MRGGSLQELGEDRLVAMLTAELRQGPRVRVGPGDDCAVLEGSGRWDFLLKTDVVVEGVHYLREAPGGKVGWKAMARAVSDVAAMGGRPVAAVVTLVLPGDREAGWLRALYRGFSRCSRRWGFDVVGGETSAAPAGSAAMINVAMLGEVERGRAVLRSGARAGDVILVTGRLGGSLRRWHLEFEPRVAEARWLARHWRPTAMMDLSDGLAQDLPRLARASGLGWQVEDERLPRRRGATVRQAWGDGEDYELLFTIAPEQAAELQECWPGEFPRLRLTAIGRMTAEAAQPPAQGGWEHFRARAD